MLGAVRGILQQPHTSITSVEAMPKALAPVVRSQGKGIQRIDRVGNHGPNWK